MSTDIDSLPPLGSAAHDWFLGQPTGTTSFVPWSAGGALEFQQASAVPFRRRPTGLEVCLITSSAGRWLFPKGLIDPGETPTQTALKEALEEAGLHGRLLGDPLGSYVVRKNGHTVCLLAFLMEVKRSDHVWHEADWRQRRWVSIDKARTLLEQPELRACLEAALARL
jgi:8-oxo-dGTP pyrophosphatase MutT (NUDIX family)